jgi:methylphosphotriester-DNA--protein-cysteine methyltransferase
MKNVNRVFFSAMEEAVASGYRPCAHCMRKEYKIWKDGIEQGHRIRKSPAL